MPETPAPFWKAWLDGIGPPSAVQRALAHLDQHPFPNDTEATVILHTLWPVLPLAVRQEVLRTMRDTLRGDARPRE